MKCTRYLSLSHLLPFPSIFPISSVSFPSHFPFFKCWYSKTILYLNGCSLQHCFKTPLWPYHLKRQHPRRFCSNLLANGMYIISDRALIYVSRWSKHGSLGWKWVWRQKCILVSNHTESLFINIATTGRFVKHLPL